MLGKFFNLTGLLIIGLCVFLISGGVMAAAPAASDARLGGDNSKTRFVMELDALIKFNVFTLADPYRVIVDLPEINFQLPPGRGESKLGLVKAFRFGLFSSGRSRIVIDASAPVMIEKSFVLPPEKGKKARLVIDLIRTSREEFLKKTASAAAMRRAQQQRRMSAASTLKGANIPLPRSKPRKLPGVNKHKGKQVIVIDPGHGGIDPGAIGKRKSKEKNIVFAFSRALAAKLKATGRYKVHLTRNRDVFIRLRDRVRIANKHNADLFISIHADSIGKRSIRGATIYTLSEKSSDKEAAALAAKENRADIIAGVDLDDAPDELAGIFIDLAQREAKNESIKFAKTAVRKMKRKIRMNANPHRYAGFRVLKSPNFPSVLIELGYLSSPRDENLMRSKNWRIKTASSLTGAINSYFVKRYAHSTR